MHTLNAVSAVPDSWLQPGMAMPEQERYRGAHATFTFAWDFRCGIMNQHSTLEENYATTKRSTFVK